MRWPALNDVDEWRHLVEERAAILEHEGEPGALDADQAYALAREWAEALWRQLKEER